MYWIVVVNDDSSKIKKMIDKILIIIIIICFLLLVFFNTGVVIDGGVDNDQYNFIVSDIFGYHSVNVSSFAWYVTGPVIKGGYVFNSREVVITSDTLLGGDYNITVVVLTNQSETVVVDGHPIRISGGKHDITVSPSSHTCRHWTDMSTGRWVSKSLLSTAARANYPVIPDDRLIPNCNCKEMFDKSAFNHPFMARSQDYVWVPSNCTLPWRSLVVNITKIVFMGTSRMRNLSMDFKKYNIPKQLIVHEQLAWKKLNNNGHLNRLMTKYCVGTTIVIFSTGFWESITGKDQRHLYLDDFKEYMRDILTTLVTNCGNRLILVTEPTVHPISVTQHMSVRDVDAIPIELKWERTMAMNGVVREFAMERGIPLVDSEVLTASRYDASLDGVHYVCGDCNIRTCLVSGGMGSDVTHTIIQILIRQIDIILKNIND